MRNKTIIAKRFARAVGALSCLALSLLVCDFTVAQTTPKSSRIRVEGVSDAQMKRVQLAIETAAYPTGRASTNPVRRSSRATEIENEDECSSFYMPTPKFRLLKQLPETDPCQNLGTTVLADTEIQVIFLCKNGKSIADYDFAMGRNGAGKRALGDKKTPLGRYALGKPGASVDGFKVFIPIGYPTLEQKQAGYTGLAIGIHGPHRNFRCAGFLNAAVNWTQGCLAVASDIYIKEIGRFVEQNSIKDITIHPLGTL